MNAQESANLGTWSVWGDRLTAGLAIFTCVGLAWAWSGVFYLSQPINEILAFKVSDTDLLGEQGAFRTVLGSHAFGDFQAPIYWAFQVVSGEYPVPSPPYLPASFLYGFLYLNATPSAAVAIHQIITLGVTVVAGGLLLRGVSASKRIVILFFSVVVTVPMIASLDTGNLQGLTIALAFVALVFLQRRQSRPAWILVGVAIAFKGYPALVLAWPLAAGWWRFALRSIFVTVTLSVALFALMPGGIFVSVGQYVGGLTERTGQGMLDAESSLAALTAKAAGIVAGPDAMSELSASGLLSLACAVLWVGAVAILASTRLLPQWAIAILALSTLQMAVPTSYNYSLGWASIAAIWFGMGTLFPDNPTSRGQIRNVSRESPVLRWTGLFALVATLAPIGYRFAYNGVVVNVSTIVSPVLLVLFMCIAVVYAVGKFRVGKLSFSGRADGKKPSSSQ